MSSSNNYSKQHMEDNQMGKSATYAGEPTPHLRSTQPKYIPDQPVMQQVKDYIRVNWTAKALIDDWTPDYKAYFMALGPLKHYPLFQQLGEIDAFVSLFTNNLSTLLVIVFGLTTIWDEETIYHRFLPGVGLAMLWGNILYWWQGRALAYREQRSTVCVQPYGINTPGAFAFLYSICFPVYYSSGQDAHLSWLAAVACNLIQGLIIIGFILIGEIVRKLTPPVALLASIASVGIGFLGFSQLLDLTAVPIIALIPFVITMVGYFGKVRFGFMPPVLLALIIGTGISWASTTQADYYGALNGGINKNTAAGVRASASVVQPYAPVFAMTEVGSAFNQVGPYVAIIIPNAISVAIGTIQCVESAKRAGDSYSVRISLFIDGCGTVIASFFGSFLGMTVFIGHPAFKRMGGRQLYSAANGIVFAVICFFGVVSPILSSISLYSINPIIIFIGLVITTDTLLITPKRHIPACLLGLLPVFANIGVATVGSSVASTYDSLLSYQNGGTGPVDVNGNPVNSSTFPSQVTGMDYIGMTNMSNGYVLTSILWAALFIYMIDRQFLKAAAWGFLSAWLAFFGVIHSPTVLVTTRYDQFNWTFCVAYGMVTVLFLLFWVAQRHGLMEQPDTRPNFLNYPTDDVDFTEDGFYSDHGFVKTKVEDDSTSRSPGNFDEFQKDGSHVVSMPHEQEYELRRRVDPAYLQSHPSINFTNSLARPNHEVEGNNKMMSNDSHYAEQPSEHHSPLHETSPVHAGGEDSSEYTPGPYARV